VSFKDNPFLKANKAKAAAPKVSLGAVHTSLPVSTQVTVKGQLPPTADLINRNDGDVDETEESKPEHRSSFKDNPFLKKNTQAISKPAVVAAVKPEASQPATIEVNERVRTTVYSVSDSSVVTPASEATASAVEVVDVNQMHVVAGAESVSPSPAAVASQEIEAAGTCMPTADLADIVEDLAGANAGESCCYCMSVCLSVCLSV
jgi:hypothetical protein